MFDMAICRGDLVTELIQEIHIYQNIKEKYSFSGY